MAGDGTLSARLGLEELPGVQSGLLQALLAEFIGTLVLNLFGCGACVNVDRTKTADVVLVALSFGLAVLAVVSAIGHVSGGHVNPAVTIGLLAVGQIKVVRAILYIIVQCAGAAAGSGFLYSLTPVNISQLQGLTKIDESNGMSPAQGFGIEFFLGFVLLLVVCGVCDPNKPESKSTAPIAIGLTITLGHLLAVPYTGSAMNPARAFGSAVVVNNWVPYHWVYWVGPILGGLVAALLYKYVLAAPPSATAHYTRAPATESELKRLDGKMEDA